MNKINLSRKAKVAGMAVGMLVFSVLSYHAGVTLVNYTNSQLDKAAVSRVKDRDLMRHDAALIQEVPVVKAADVSSQIKSEIDNQLK